MNILQALKKSTDFVERVTNQSQLESKIEAEHIFMFVLKINRPKLYGKLNSTLTDSNNKIIEDILELRKNKPLSYILERHTFYKDEFYINNNVLIPRPETESIIDEVLRQGDLLFKEKNKCIFLDAGTGSGCVGITIANERPKWKVILLDLYSEAIEVAKINIEANCLKNIRYVQSNWFENINNSIFDIIISNPPYISKEDPHLKQPELIKQPHIALISDDKGLKDIKTIV